MRVSLKERGSDGYPFSVPAIATLPMLDVHVGVTFFVGENGSGKSTLLEGIAAAAELSALGSSDVAVDDTLAPARHLARVLRLAWSIRSRRGFFLRAEDFFGFHKMRARMDARIARELGERDIAPNDRPALAEGAAHVDEEHAARFIAHYDAESHGESFMRAFKERIEPGGLYLLDEPEAPLSPKRQIELLRFLVSSSRQGAQFVIATHSPILLACPDARIYSFDATPVARVHYDELEHVAVLRAFLNDPGAFLDR